MDSDFMKLDGTNMYVAVRHGAHFDNLYRVELGEIVITRRWRRHTMYDSIYSALRSRVEIALKYGVEKAGNDRSELRQLEQLKGFVTSAHVALGESASVARVQPLFAAIEGGLARKRNAHKKDAAARAASGAVTTSRGAVNRGATKARLTAIGRRLTLREHEASAIARRIGADGRALFRLLHGQLEIVRDIDRAVSALCVHEFARRGTTTAKQRAAIASRIHFLEGEAAALKVAPFSRFTALLRGHLEIAAECAELGDSKVFCRRLDSVLQMTTQIFVHKRLEDAIMLCAVASYGADTPTTRRDLRKNLSRIRSWFAALSTTSSPALRFSLIFSPEKASLIDIAMLDADRAVTNGDILSAKDALKSMAQRLFSY